MSDSNYYEFLAEQDIKCFIIQNGVIKGKVNSKHQWKISEPKILHQVYENIINRIQDAYPNLEVRSFTTHLDLGENHACKKSINTNIYKRNYTNN